jgi:hypothetical protein
VNRVTGLRTWVYSTVSRGRPSPGSVQVTETATS